jgi:hypothetical protein
MLKKVTTDIKAAIILIVTEDIAALRMFNRGLANSFFKTAAENHQTKRQSKEESMARKEV